MDAILAYLMSDHSEFVEPQPYGFGFSERPFALHHLQYLQLRVFERDKEVTAPFARRAAIAHQGLGADLEDLQPIVKADPECDGRAFRDTGPESFIDIYRHGNLPPHA
ncbi:hypothetical protein PQQ52_26830 [Paraburkholderia sediminicola]